MNWDRYSLALVLFFVLTIFMILLGGIANVGGDWVTVVIAFPGAFGAAYLGAKVGGEAAKEAAIEGAREAEKLKYIPKLYEKIEQAQKETLRLVNFTEYNENFSKQEKVANETVLEFDRVRFYSDYFLKDDQVNKLLEALKFNLDNFIILYRPIIEYLNEIKKLDDEKEKEYNGLRKDADPADISKYKEGRDEKYAEKLKPIEEKLDGEKEVQEEYRKNIDDIFFKLGNLLKAN